MDFLQHAQNILLSDLLLDRFLVCRCLNKTVACIIYRLLYHIASYEL